MKFYWLNINEMEQSNHIPLKLRLFLPIVFIIIAVITIATIFFIDNSIKTFNLQIEDNLRLEVKTIEKMFERERQLKLEKVETNLKVAHNLFYNQQLNISNEKISILAKKQGSSNEIQVKIQKWLLNNQILHDNHSFVDSISSLLGGTATIFQKIDSGYVRISTNVLNIDGSRAINTFIPNTSPVIQSILKGKRYFGRAYVVNDWYITAYEPIFKNNEPIGILYVGNHEKDLQKLRDVLQALKIGKSGYPFVFDKSGQMIIHPTLEGQNWQDSSLFRQFIRQETDIVNYHFQGKNKTAAFLYYDDFELYIAASIETKEETKEFIKNTIITSSVIAVLTIFILLSMLYFLTADRIYRYLKQLNLSREKLHSTKKALKESEERFQKLFNSTGDDIFVTDSNENIIEVNNASCVTLKFSRKDLLNKKMSDIKTEKYKHLVAENRKKIFEQGIYTFESEHVTNDNKIIPVEITSRVLDYNNEKLILSISRNVGHRKETEREILSTIIRTEERERERFAKDMHDSVGPLLSTIKLYVNELKASTLKEEERIEFVDQTNEIIDEAINSIRTISNNLMPRVIHKYGLIKALESFFDKINKTNTIEIKFVNEKIGGRLDNNLELILFRVITELINNTLKHAKAKEINIRLIKWPDKVTLGFKDDGIGFDIDEIMHSDHKGMGLKNIISRIKSINGFYDFISAPNKGFKFKINIDL